MECEIDRCISTVNPLYRSVMVMKELHEKAKLSIYWSVYIPTLPMVMNIWTLRDRVRSSVTWKELSIEPLCLYIKRSRLWWLGQLYQMLPGRIPQEILQACSTRRRPRGRPRTRWSDYVIRVAWEHLGLLPLELEDVSCLKSGWPCLDCYPAPEKQKRMNGWTEGWVDGRMDDKHTRTSRLKVFIITPPWRHTYLTASCIAFRFSTVFSIIRRLLIHCCCIHLYCKRISSRSISAYTQITENMSVLIIIHSLRRGVQKSTYEERHCTSNIQ